MNIWICFRDEHLLIQPHKRRLPWRNAWQPHAGEKRLPVTHREDVLARQTTIGMMMSGFSRRLRSAFGKDSIGPADPIHVAALVFFAFFL